MKRYRSPEELLRHRLSRGHKITEMDIIAIVLEYLWSGGTWCRFPLPLVKVMSEQEALILSVLMSKKDAVMASERYSDWFYCKQSFIKRKTGYSFRKQTRIFQKLRDKGFIVTEMRPGKKGLKQYYHIDLVAVSKTLVNELRKEFEQEG